MPLNIALIGNKNNTTFPSFIEKKNQSLRPLLRKGRANREIKHMADINTVINTYEGQKTRCNCELKIQATMFSILPPSIFASSELKWISKDIDQSTYLWTGQWG